MDGAGGKSIHVASIAGPHGVRGLVRLQSFTDPVEGLAAYETLADEQGQRFAIQLLSRDKTHYPRPRRGSRRPHESRNAEGPEAVRAARRPAANRKMARTTMPT